MYSSTDSTNISALTCQYRTRETDLMKHCNVSLFLPVGIFLLKKNLWVANCSFTLDINELSISELSTCSSPDSPWKPPNNSPQSSQSTPAIHPKAPQNMIGVDRVNWVGLICNLLHPPLLPILFPRDHITAARKFFEDLIKARDGQPRLSPRLSATGSRVTPCGSLTPQ